MLSREQIKAARGLLGWSQSKLAANCENVSEPTIKLIESGKVNSTPATLADVQNTFEKEGLEFLPQNGLRQRSSDVRVYKGTQGLFEFYNDVYQTVRDYEGDILVNNVDERKFVDALGEFASTHVERMKKLDNITYKILICEGDTYTPGSDYAEYRWIPQELFASVPFYVYADKLAIMLLTHEPSVIVMDYQEIAMAYRVQFYDLWEKSTPVKGHIVKNIEG